jgi:hypothetical protein
MADILGLPVGDLKLPKVSITGIASSSWIYVAIVAVLGVLVIAAIALILYKKTYNKRVVIFENIAGKGYQPTVRTVARVIKVGNGGMEILKTAGGTFLDAYGKKMGTNTYWFAKGPDGFYYNILLGDLDSKMGMLDIEPVDRDVRMWHTGVERLREQTYNKKGWLDEHANQMIMFGFLIVLVLGMWFIVGKIGDAMKPLVEVAKTNQAVLEALQGVLQGANNLKAQIGGSGIIPVVN